MTSKTHLPKIALAAFAAAVLAGCSSTCRWTRTRPARLSSRARQPTGLAVRVAGTGGTEQARHAGRRDRQDRQRRAERPAPGGVLRLRQLRRQGRVPPTVEANAKVLTADRAKKVVIEGHTDERGGREYNLALGQKRAEAVGRSLALLGAQGSQIEAVSFGKERPAVQGSDEAAWAKNRRAEMVYR